ncbi:MAG: pyruvate dehydrogenase (acetyl-transferring) E1 component subunit alpha, partial [Verrucomicrobia bacterium]|nr:pyruvate dehydrogenase (acetyl-transferring) E1 component subunit alpha [Verrucomicrobiota bacterium]
EEIERYKTRHDPLRIWTQTLLNEAIITEAQVEQIDREAKEETNAAVQFAEESPFPDESEILSDVYWEVDHQIDAAKNGRYFFNS